MKKIYLSLLTTALSFSVITAVAQNNTANPTANHDNITTGINNTSIGVDADSALTTGEGNVAVGFKAMLNNTNRDGNVGIGQYAGKNVSSNRNVLIGNYAGAGVDASDYSDLENSMRGGDNVIIGDEAGIENDNADNNVFIGREAGKKNDDGDDNVFVGKSAGEENSDGGNNVYVGKSAGELTENGENNTFIGKSAGEESIGGENNTFIGYRAGIGSEDAKRVVALGDSAGASSLGNRNVFIGSLAGIGVVDGKNNVFLGANTNVAGVDSADIEHSVAIGHEAKVSISDAIILGDTANTDIKVGIGTASPRYKLDVVGVVNMKVAYGGNAMKVNDETIIAVNPNGDAVLQNVKVQYDQEQEWSDKVYDENYPLMTIEEMGAFVKENKHLPNVPSAKEVVEEGVEMKVMLSKLLEKIEEQSLYILQLKKEMDEMKKVSTMK